jgi:Short C-terminal domain
MRQLSAAGQRAINDLAQRHGFSSDAVASMLESVVNGNGAMAQFSHPEFGGSGQWMRGGMIMVSDMFNNSLKGRIDGLCNELSGLVANEADLISNGSFQSQSQGGQRQAAYGGGQQQQSGSGPVGRVSLFVSPSAGSSGHWWPTDLGRPTSTGAQNDVRYAYFAQTRRLAIEVNGRVTVYDTLDHQISGFSQQQSSGGSLTFSSQHGLVDVASLPVLSVDGVPRHAPVPTPTPSPVPQSSVGAPSVGQADVFATIEKLAELRDKGILGEEEFATKKAELLARL